MCNNYVLAPRDDILPSISIETVFNIGLSGVCVGFYILTWGLHSAHDWHIIKYFMLEELLVGDYYN